MSELFQGWLANLSTGETAIEAPQIAGEMTPWRKLLMYLKKHPEIKMTGLQLVREGVVVTALPHYEVDGYFQAYECRTTLTGKVENTSQGIGSVIGDKVYITWLAYSDGNVQVFQDVRSLESSKVHTTLG